MSGRYYTKYNKHYSSPKHKYWRDIIRARDMVCQYCKAKGLTTQGVEVHHIIPLEKDITLAFDLENGVLLCKACHDKQHERESALSKFLRERRE